MSSSLNWKLSFEQSLPTLLSAAHTHTTRELSNLLPCYYLGHVTLNHTFWGHWWLCSSKHISLIETFLILSAANYPAEFSAKFKIVQQSHPYQVFNWHSTICINLVKSNPPPTFILNKELNVLSLGGKAQLCIWN